jgi:septal ring factor EnvC (AmiA/AmiB activator)
VLLTVAQLFSAIAVANQAEQQQAELKALKAAIVSAQKELKTKTDKLGNIEKDIARAERKIGELSNSKRQLNGEIGAIERQIEQLRQRSLELNQEIDQQKTRISEQLVEVYKRGNLSPIQLLLDSGNPADIDRQLVYLEKLNHARIERVEEFRQLLQEQQQLENQKREQQQQLLGKRDELKQREQELTQAQTTRREKLQALSVSIASDQSALKKMRADQQALEALLEEMTAALNSDESTWSGYQAKLDTGAQFGKAKGRLPWPIQNAKLSKDRNGVSIAANKGTEVKAIFGGRIIFADWFRGQGLLIILDHGDNYWSLYGHNESLLKSPGDTVAAGETIATVGNSGGQSRDALYFEIRHKGEPQKPAQWCKS